jgi:hypothetical protein
MYYKYINRKTNPEMQKYNAPGTIRAHGINLCHDQVDALVPQISK